MPDLALIEGGERPPALGPALELAGLGAALTLTIALIARLPSWFRDLGTFQLLYALAFVFYAAAVLRLRTWEKLPHAGLAVFAVALATRAALLPAPPSLSGDLYRYVWEGRVVVAGGDPYRQSPDDPALAPLRDRAIHPSINHPGLSTIYPPLGMAGFALVAAVSPTVIAMKTWVVLHDLAIVALLIRWAQRRTGSSAVALAYAWNPLVLIEFAGNGHNDPTAMVWWIAALMLVERRPVWSAVALSVAALVKLVPLLSLPLLFARWSVRARLVCLAILVPGLAWFVHATAHPGSGRVAFWDQWRNNELVFDGLARLLGGDAPAKLAAIAIVGAVLVFARSRRWRAERGTRLATRAALLVSPVLHPWYLGWALALEPLAPSAPWLLLSLTAILNYGVLATPAEGRSFHLPLAWRVLEYGLPLLLAVVLALTRRTAPPPAPRLVERENS